MKCDKIGVGKPSTFFYIGHTKIRQEPLDTDRRGMIKCESAKPRTYKMRK